MVEDRSQWGSVSYLLGHQQKDGSELPWLALPL